MNVTHEIVLDVNIDTLETINIKQYTKNSHILHIRLTENGIDYPIDSNTVKCQFKMLTPNKNHILIDAVINNDGTITVTLPEAACLAPGNGTAELLFVQPKNSDTDYDYVLLSMTFNINIIKSVYNHDDIVPYDDFNALNHALIKVNKDYEYVMESARISANAAEVSRNAARTFANNAEQSKNNASNHAANAQSAAGNAASSANIALQYSNNADASKNIALQNANAAASSATEAKSYAVGNTNTRPNENTENAKYYYTESKKYYDNLSQAGTVTGVKGSSESFYRTGNVDITAANVGAVSEATGNTIYARANTAYNQANIAYTRANNAYAQANSAYNQANVASTAAGNAYARANTAYSQANAAYNQANSAYNKTTSSNLALGYTPTSSGYFSIAIGHSASAKNSSSIAIGFGSSAVYAFSIALGNCAVASGDNSIAIGGFAKASGNYSTTLGHNANANGSYSTALGHYANASSSFSTAIGGFTNASSYNATALGYHANASSSYSTALGSYANASDYSTALGHHANASSYNSIALGYHANASGSHSAALGYFAKTSSYNSIALGYHANASGSYSTALGYLAVVANTSTNTIQLGNASSLSTLSCRVALTVTSDERDKADITEIGDGAVEFLKKIHAIRYVFNHRELYIDEENLSEEERKKKEMYGLCAYDKESHAKGTKKGSRMRVGVSAQETLKALKEVYGSSSYANLINDNLFDVNPDEIPEGVENQLTANYEGFIPFLIKAVQELAERLEAVEETRKGRAA